jgi:hypothetical protein
LEREGIGELENVRVGELKFKIIKRQKKTE